MLSFPYTFIYLGRLLELPAFLIFCSNQLHLGSSWSNLLRVEFSPAFGESCNFSFLAKESHYKQNMNDPLSTCVQREFCHLNFLLFYFFLSLSYSFCFFLIYKFTGISFENSDLQCRWLGLRIFFYIEILKYINDLFQF